MRHPLPRSTPGITFGFIGFCTGTFDGNMVVKRYCERRAGNCMAKYCEALDKIDEVNRSRFDYAGNDDITGLDGFVEAVAGGWAGWGLVGVGVGGKRFVLGEHAVRTLYHTEAGQDPEFIAAQVDVHDELTWAPMVAKVRETGVRRPLTIALLYDTWVQHGESGTADIIASAGAAEPTPAAGGPEPDFFWALTNRRREALMTTEGKGEVWRESVERVSIYEELGSEGVADWGLDGPIVISATRPDAGFWVQNTNYGEFVLP